VCQPYETHASLRHIDTAEERGITNTTIHQLFAADGALATAMERFSPRREQVALADEIDCAMQNGDDLIAEAETGTGKTLAYLVPTLISDQKVLISTHTKALQDQLMYRDIPAVQQAMGHNRAIALLKGRNNYLCPHRLEQALTSHQLPLWMESPLMAVQRWSERSRDGDLSGLGFDPFRQGVAAQITATAEQCLGSRCAHFSRCPLMKARQRAQDADVVISNHSLLLADARLKSEGFGAVLPDFDCYILDEAHGLPALASAHFGVQLSRSKVNYWLRDVQIALEEEGSAPHLLQSIGDQGRELLVEWAAASLEELADRWADLVKMLAEHEVECDELQKLQMRGAMISAEFDSIQQPDDGFVAWQSGSGEKRHWQAAPVETAPVLEQYLWYYPASFTLLSATFRVSESFNHIKRNIGLPDAVELFHPSPFNYATQALIYIPRHQPPATSDGSEACMAETMESLLRASSGRAFVLFTSYRAMHAVAPQLQRSLPWSVLIQGEGESRDALLQQFREETESVLCGTRSFWEGVDVPGETLSMVIIDKIPFAPPSDPLLAARVRHCEERGGNGFRDIQLPEAIAVLRQGVGRLIRNEQDRGVMAILDSRLYNKFYGREVLRNLPSAPLCDDLAEVRWFFENR
ncbi:MAG: ATP-dependent DNA helicase, partial [Mariprofundales bacterium]|nr:ATP-dependent DNA helicase [Mariprofundales bacterium]